jgi:Protein of unknown function (DUF4038)
MDGRRRDVPVRSHDHDSGALHIGSSVDTRSRPRQIDLANPSPDRRLQRWSGFWDRIYNEVARQEGDRCRPRRHRLGLMLNAMRDNISAGLYEVVEMEIGPVVQQADRLNLGEYDAFVTDPFGSTRLVPALERGGRWWVRYASAVAGRHLVRFGDLSQPAQIAIDVAERATTHPVLAHGPLVRAPDKRILTHADGTPFLWLADTWWYALASRLSDDDFRSLAQKRRAQGFSVIQLVAGLYPETTPFSPEGMNEGGWVWQDNFATPNAAMVLGGRQADPMAD